MKSASRRKCPDYSKPTDFQEFKRQYLAALERGRRERICAEKAARTTSDREGLAA